MIEFKKEGLSVTSNVDFTEFDAGDDPEENEWRPPALF